MINKISIKYNEINILIDLQIEKLFHSKLNFYNKFHHTLAYLILIGIIFSIVEFRLYIHPILVISSGIISLIISIWGAIYTIIEERNKSMIELVYQFDRHDYDNFEQYRNKFTRSEAVSYLGQFVTHMMERIKYISYLRIFFLFSRYLIVLLNLSVISYSLEKYYDTDNLFFKGITQSNNYFDHVYFNAITFATIGYGDIHPAINYENSSHCDIARMYVLLTVFCGIVFLIFTGIFFSNFFNTSWEQFNKAVLDFMTIETG